MFVLSQFSYKGIFNRFDISTVCNLFVLYITSFIHWPYNISGQLKDMLSLICGYDTLKVVHFSHYVVKHRFILHIFFCSPIYWVQCSAELYDI